jgi:hypothetical protein
MRKHRNIVPTIPLEGFPYVLLVQLQLIRGFHSFSLQGMPKKFLMEEY